MILLHVVIQPSPNHSLKRLSFITSNTLCHLLLADTVSAEKSADCLTGVPLYLTSCFLLLLLRLSLYLSSFPFNYDASQHGFLQVHLIRDSVCFLNLYPSPG